MSGDPGLQYFADGTTENVIANLARSPQIKVVARTSTDAYKGKSVDIRQIGKELGARYVLEGSIQKSAEKMRIVAQLIDTRNGDHVWAETFDRQGSDPLALQDEVSESVVRTLAGDTGLIKKKQYEDEWGKDTARLDEWDYYLRGHELLQRFTKEDTNKAAQIWEEGLAKYPDSALLKAKLGWASYQRWFHGWSADASGEAQKAIRYAQEALAAPGAPPLALGLAHWLFECRAVERLAKLRVLYFAQSSHTAIVSWLFYLAARVITSEPFADSKRKYGTQNGNNSPGACPKSIYS
jgi:adenylate cyclase